ALRLVAITRTASAAGLVMFVHSRAAPLPLADVGHRRPRLGRRERGTALQQLDRDQIGRAYECHAAIARRPADLVARLDEPLACTVDIVHFIRNVTEVATHRI